ncbi:MAG: DNA polymerase III subunit delta [Solirubrobacterales bacterium]
MDNKHIFYGIDERLILEKVNSIIKDNVDKDFKELNLSKFDGSTLDKFDDVINACQTLPFMSEKKVVLITRANFLEDSKSEFSKSGDEKMFKQFLEYVENVPEHCVLIVYFVLKNKRDKSTDRIKKLEKKVKATKIEKATGVKLEAKIKELFKIRGAEIGKIELKAFIDKMQENNLDVINNEVEKLCCYTFGREIKRQDINDLFSETSDDDIFDLINPLSQKKANEALKILDELLFKGGKVNYIINMVEKHFVMLLKIKLYLESGRDKEFVGRELKLSPYRCDILLNQSRKFTEKQLKKVVDYCLESERKMKTSPTDHKTELEMLIVNIAALK